MGLVKIRKGDGQIVFHVGKELPEAGSDFLLVPGKQNAQGRGVYATEGFPQLQYAGGEHYQKTLDRSPVFLVPMQGTWAKAVMKKKNNKVVLHSDGKLILMHDMRVMDGEIDGKPVRYYASSDIELIEEPPEQDRMGSLLECLREGKLTQAEVLLALKALPLKREKMNAGLIKEKLKEAADQGLVPPVLLEHLFSREIAHEASPFKVK